MGVRIPRVAVVLALAAGLVVVPVVGSPQPNPALDLVVDSSLDAPDADPGDGVCDSPAETCTLRAAIMEINATGTDGHTVSLPAGTVELAATGATDTLGDLDVRRGLTIEGPPGGAATIDATGLDNRIFDIRTGAVVRLRNLVLVGGDATDPAASAGDGGAIRFCGLVESSDDVVPTVDAGRLVLESVRLEGNAAAGDGGAVAFQAPEGDGDPDTVGSLRLTDVTADGNVAGDDGGAVAADRAACSGRLTVVKDATGNLAPDGETFTLLVDCPAIGFEASVTLLDGESETFTDVPGGTECTVTETDTGGAPSVTIQDSDGEAGDGTVTIRDGETDTVIVTNAYGDLIGSPAVPPAPSFLARVAGPLAGAAFAQTATPEPTPSAVDPAPPGAVVIEDSALTGNRATGEFGAGGAVWSRRLELRIRDTVLAGNDARRGGAVAGGPATLARVQVRGNTATVGGGGLDVGEATVRESVVADNHSGATGGGIEVGFGELTVIDTEVRGNSADGSGGGIAVVSSEASLAGVTVAGNDAAEAGGGILVEESDGASQLTVERSAVLANTAVRGGGLMTGGPVGAGSDSLTELSATTVSGNRAVAGEGEGSPSGGGILTADRLVLRRVTLAFNRTPRPDADAGPAASGLHLAPTADLELDHTIIAGNGRAAACVVEPGSGGSGTVPPLEPAETTSAGGNLTDARACHVGGDGDAVLPLAALDIDRLGDHGGRTLSHGLRPDSLAIDHGAAAAILPAVFPSTDQRGLAAALFGDEPAADGPPPSPRVDAGAFEFAQGVRASPAVGRAVEGGDPGAVVLRRRGRTVEPLPVTVAVAGTARRGVDYRLRFRGDALPADGRIVLPAGAARARLRVLPVADGVVEPPETVEVIVRTSTGHTLAGESSATVTLLDPPRTRVRVEVADPDLSESGSRGALLLRRTGDTARPLDVRLAVVGTATESLDFAALPRVVRIPRGRAAVRIPVRALRDGIDDPGETVGLVVRPGPAYRPAAADTATLTIDG